jgi:glycosyltransferase involved in cell wall biosynthesis
VGGIKDGRDPRQSSVLHPAEAGLRSPRLEQQAPIAGPVHTSRQLDRFSRYLRVSLMNVLFVHNNFPAQYKHIVRVLAKQPSINLAAIGCHTASAATGVKLLKYSLENAEVSATHPFARRFDVECRRAEQVLYSATSLVSSGFVPDLIMAHPGWGETLPLRTIFPKARILTYCEFYYGREDRDVGFDHEFAESGLDGHVGLHLKNAATLLAIAESNCGISPTHWQRSTYPKILQPAIRVIHEGIDVHAAKPLADASFFLSTGKELTRSDEVVTFVARNLEPVRGYHIFMRALPRILAARPRAEILIIGGDGTSYGLPPPEGTTWRSIFLGEVAEKIDKKRVHFIGHLPYSEFLRALQISSAHVYLTYPFVLSWSLMEALSTGCVVIGSDTAPVREVISDGNGILVPFFDIDQLAERVIEVLSHPRRFDGMRERARQTIVARYDVERHCLPKMMNLIKEIMA